MKDGECDITRGRLISRASPGLCHEQVRAGRRRLAYLFLPSQTQTTVLSYPLSFLMRICGMRMRHCEGECELAGIERNEK